MQIVLSSFTLEGYGLDRIFDCAKKAGFSGIDLKINPRNYDSFDSDYLNELKTRHGLEITAIEAPDNYSEKDIEKLIDLCKKIKCRILVISAPSLLKFSLAGWLKNDVPKIRRKENISIALENAKDETYLGIIPKRVMNNIYEMKKFKHACIDLSLLFEKNSDIIQTYNNLKDFLVHIHLSNATRKGLYTKLRNGVLPVESLLSKLKDNNYLGAVSLKINPKEFELKNFTETIEELKKEKEFIEKYLN